jgi:bifunctional NMN adenylyltransferase/nudix hydrolase
MLDYAVYIGRFQPFHNGHLNVIHESLKYARKVVILVGSSNTSRSPRNPFTFIERRSQINLALHEANIPFENIIFRAIEDYPYNDNKWIASVQSTVGEATNFSKSVGIVGYQKDHTSFYLRLFPQWEFIEIKTQFSTLNSSDIRNEYFKDFFRIPDSYHCSHSVIDFLTKFANTDTFQWLVKENKTNKNYNPRIYDNDIVACVDAVVIQSGHILLVERGEHPGKGLLALPGGHVNKNERFLDAAIRELREETHISDEKGEIPPAMLKSFITKKDFFDDPHRSLRARVTSMAYLFEIPNRIKLFHVKGDDDAKSANWVPLGTLDPVNFFEDHWHIINKMMEK